MAAGKGEAVEGAPLGDAKAIAAGSADDASTSCGSTDTPPRGGDLHEKSPEALEQERRWAEEMDKAKEIMESTDMSDKDRVSKLRDILTNRIEQTKNLEEAAAVELLRLQNLTRDRDTIRAEQQRMEAAKMKVQEKCRVLEEQKAEIREKNQEIVSGEESRHAELKEKFEQAIKDVEEKMAAEETAQEQIVKENEDLRSKLEQFTETYEAQEKQLQEQRDAREKELEMAKERLHDHDTKCKESTINSTKLEKENSELRKSEEKLRDELQKIMGRFDDFHERITGSNQRHGDCKDNVDALQKQLQELEKDHAELKQPPALTELIDEQKVTQKQVDALKKLHDNLRKEEKDLERDLQKLRGVRGSREASGGSMSSRGAPMCGG